MAHVQIRKIENDDRTEVVVDGFDLTNHIYADGFAIVRVDDADADEFPRWGVQMVVATDSLDIDLPDAVIQAIAKSDVEMHVADDA